MRGSGGVFAAMDGSHTLDEPPTPIWTHNGLKVTPVPTAEGLIPRVKLVGVAEVSALGTTIPRLLKVMVFVGGVGETATGAVETVTFFEPSLLDRA